MNSLVIPPSPNWFHTDIMACAPDNTLMYGSRNDIVVIKPTPDDLPDDVRIISRAHSVKIRSININRNWGAPHKYAVTLSKNNIVKLWDVETLEKKLAHNKHVLMDGAVEVIGASFAGDDRVISASENGTVILWNLILNETTVVLKTLFKGNKDKLTTLSVCPHATWLTAFGTQSGLIAVADLRKTGNVLYTLRGHSKPVVSLCWCPAPVNIFPTKPHNKVVEKKLETPNDDGDRRKQKNPKKVSSLTECYYKNKTEYQVPPADTEISSVKDSQTILEEVAPLGERPELVQGDETTLEIPDTRILPIDITCSTQEKQVTSEISQNDISCSMQNDQITTETSENPDTPTDRRILPMDISCSTEEEQVIIKISQNDVSCSMQKQQITVDISEDPDTPTDRRILPMDISYSTQKDQATTENSEKPDTPSEVCILPSYSTDSEEILLAQSEPIAKAASKESSYSKVEASNREELIYQAASKESGNLSSVTYGENETESLNRDTKAINSKELQNTQDEHVDGAHVKNWRVPESTEPVGVDEEPRKEFLLASSAREPKIYIWRAGTDGRLETFITVPTSKTSKPRKKKNWSPNSDAIWITLCWAAPNILLSSNKEAELLHWTLPKPMVQSKFLRKIHSDHWSVLFSIKAPIVYSNEYNFLQKREVFAWTTGKERMLINTEIGSMKNLACYPTLGGSVNCLAGSPLDPNRLAIGTGEGIVHLWDLGQAHKKSIEFPTFYQKILSGVTALAWHPVIENSLAWGTTEGRIGLIDVSQKSKNPKVLPQFCTSQIFKLEWGPPDQETARQNLFAVSGCKVAIFDPKANETDPTLLDVPSDMAVYTIAWKPSYSKLLVVTKSGTLVTYSRDLEVLNVTYISRKFESLLWHPDAASDDTAVSKYSETFASIAKFTEVIVFDLSIESENLDDKIVARFENRSVHIYDIAWSPHSGNHLVLADEEGIAQVFDIEAKTTISTYINPCLDPLISVHWSPIDPDYVITGSAANKIIVWKISQCTALTDKEISTERNKIIKAQQKIVKDYLIKETEQSSNKDVIVPKGKSQKKSLVVPLFYSASDDCKAQDLNKLLEWKLGNASIEPNVGDTGHIDVLDVFGDETNTQRIFEINLSSFKEKGKHQGVNLLSLFQGDISTVVKDAIDQKRVDPWIISLCPMVSPKLWQTACRTYAEQLRQERKDPLEAVTYFLACHMVEEAIQFLCEEDLFREALVLAKARFGTDNPMVTDVLDRWAKYCALQGNFELGACCYITLGKFSDAASLLFRRSSVEILKIAAELAKLSENSELHKAVVFRLNAFTLEETNKESSSRSEGVTEANDKTETTISQEKTEVEEKPEDSSNNKNNADCGSPIRIEMDSSNRELTVMETADANGLLDTRNDKEDRGI